MGSEVHLVPSLLHALRGEWNKVNDGWRNDCKNSRRGSHRHPGSDNLVPLAWAIALVAAIRMPRQLPSWLVKSEVFSWWHRELEDRSKYSLMLHEERSRIYFGWHWAPIYVAWRLGPTKAIKDMARNWLRAQLAQASLCGARVKPQRYSPPIQAKLFSSRLFIPQCGARSWSTDNRDRSKAHHMGNSAFESVAFAMIFNGWNPPQPAHVWELSIMKELGKQRPMNEFDRTLMRDAINAPQSLTREQLNHLVSLAGQARWPAYYVRFARGGACVGEGRSINSNTAPLYTMAINNDGTVHFLALDSGARQAHNINHEPCGLTFSVNGDRVSDVRAWAGGEDRPRKVMEFNYRQWGDLIYIAHVTSRGAKVIWPQMSPPIPGPPPPVPPSEEEDDDSTIDKIVDIITAPFRFLRDLLGL